MEGLDRFDAGKDLGMTRCWPLPADHSAASAARSIVAGELADHPMVDDAVLVVSELTTNALEHGEHPVELAIDSQPTRIRIQVTNAGAAGAPEVRAAGDLDDGGRGLAITEALSLAWGWGVDADRTTVWADFPPG
jgi:anti-sigma regulatory factor (Ser/Thr protein kinase)